MVVTVDALCQLEFTSLTEELSRNPGLLFCKYPHPVQEEGTEILHAAPSLGGLWCGGRWPV